MVGERFDMCPENRRGLAFTQGAFTQGQTLSGVYPGAFTQGQTLSGA
jgi:hypothetical protein